ncbi:MATE family efflux transporter [Novisyntrophococcus fermenticellae]|uniref:MATE family efflux transporter n=1 Tax=Novisyntrophococcus fermenticellae TaxID=2068655 RepID=UPI001E46E6BF|nr:MATE family efflux transporter [Novisyntrophococcus fermenticellae]
MLQHQNSGFYKTFLKLSFFIILQNVVTISVNLLDNVMLAHYSEPAMAGSSIVNQIQFVYQQAVTALAEAAVIIGSQYWGAKKEKQNQDIARCALRTGLVVCIVMFTAVSIFDKPILSWFTKDTVILSEAEKYLAIIRITYIFSVISTILLGFLRSREIVKIGFMVSVAALCTNGFFNYLMIFGKAGFPEMGIKGAAIATLISRIVEFLIVVIYTMNKVEIPRHHISVITPGLMKDYIKCLLPLMGTAVLWSISSALQTVILGNMSSTALSANAVSSNIFLMVKAAATGTALAGGVMIGKVIGEGDEQAVKKTSKNLQTAFFIIALVGALILYMIRIPVLNFYNISPATKKLANQFLILMSVIYIGMGYQMPTSEGIIKGGGSPTFILLMNIISSWGIVIPVSCYLAFVKQADPIFVLAALNSDQIFKCIPVFIKTNYGHWMKKLTREEM